jgi:hypothetical protein
LYCVNCIEMIRFIYLTKRVFTITKKGVNETMVDWFERTGKLAYENDYHMSRNVIHASANKELDGIIISINQKTKKGIWQPPTIDITHGYIERENKLGIKYKLNIMGIVD